MAIGGKMEIPPPIGQAAVELGFDSRIENPLNPLTVQWDNQFGQTEDC